MKIFYKRKQMLGLAVSAAVLSNSLVVGNAMENKNEDVDANYSVKEEIVVTNDSNEENGVSAKAARASLGTYKVTADSLNVRSGPGTNYSSIGGLKKGATIVVDSISSGWAKFNFNGKTAYCSASYLDKVSSSTSMKVTTDSLNVRSGASTSYSVIGELKKGTVIEVDSISSGWAKFNFNGKTAYCSASYLEKATTSGGSTSTTDNTATVTDDVNLRDSASWSANKMLVIKKGEAVEVISKDSTWTKVKYAGKTGYVPNDYLKGGVSTTTVEKTTVTDDVNLRDDASWSAKKILVIKKGEAVEVISKDSTWTKVKYAGKTGYIPTEYTSNVTGGGSSTTTTKKYVVTADSLNVRTGPGTNYNQIGSVKRGDIVEVYEISSGWAKIKQGTGTAYVSASYIDVYVEGSTNNTQNINKTIFIDPGHGGTDPGAIGSTYGTLEKEAALDVGKKLMSKLQAKGYKVLYSRNTDVYVNLSTRSGKANESKSTLFVSMHFNSATSSAATGIETLYKVDGRTSNVLADKVQKELIKKTGLRDRGLKQRSDLAVLNGTKMPAILVEGGFLSNSTDENSIINDAFRNKLADAIVAGIEGYFSVQK